MKHSALHSVAHNVADSLASGCSLLTGCYEFDLFTDLGASGNSEVTIDFLAGKLSVNVSDQLEEAARRVPAVMGDLCERQGGAIDDFCAASTRFWSDGIGHRFDVTVADRRGRRTTIEYDGQPAKRLTTLDQLGRRRPKPPTSAVVS